MANPFDQFDAPAPVAAKSTGNPFDQFDNAPASSSTPSVVNFRPTNPSPTQGGQSNTSMLSDFGSALIHHLGDKAVSGVQFLANRSNDLLNSINASADPGAQTNQTTNAEHTAGAQQVNAMVKARDAQYQATVPNSPAAYTGAAVGEILPMLATGAGGLIAKGGDIAKAGAGAIGLTGKVMPWLANKLGQSAGGAVLGAATSAATPVTNVTAQNPYSEALPNQIQSGAETGAVLPIAGDAVAGLGNYIGRNVNSLVQPFTAKGQNTIADNVLNNLARGGNTAADLTEYVPGSKPTLAQATGNANIAGAERVLSATEANRFDQSANDNARTALFNQHAGDDKTLAALQMQRDDTALPFLQSAMANKTPVQPTNTISAINTILNSPGGDRDAVQSVLGNIKSKLVDDAGNILPKANDPEYLYQTVRKQIGDLLDKRASVSNPAAQQASSELMTVKDALDQDITKGAKGFDQYLQTYSDASKPIDAQSFLQDLKLTDTQGNITLAKAQSALDKITSLQKKPGVNPAKSISQDQIDALTAIRDDLKREGNSSNGKAIGANTFQNFGVSNAIQNALPGLAGRIAGKATPEMLGSGLGAGVGYVLGAPVTGAAVGNGLGRGVSGLMSGSDEKIRNLIINKLADPYSGAAALNSANAPAKQSVFNALTNRVAPYYLPSVTITGTKALNQSR